MRYSSPRPRLESAVLKRSIGLIVIAAAMSGCGGSAPVQSVAVPDSIKPPSGSLLTLQSHAKGVQIYVCKETAPERFEWVFKAPEATLIDQAGNKIARHLAGPTWKGT